MATPAAFLTGTRILDLSIWRPGPFATSLLTALGADTIKVEPPGGDPMRHYGGLFAEINAGKRSVVLDLKDAADRDRALGLAADADVVVEGFRPGVMTRLGLDDAAVRAGNPGVVYCSISGYGQHDARAALPGHDVNYQAWAGALTPEGGTGRMPPLPAADLAAGTTAAFGICAALLGRQHSGVGAYLDVSMTDVLSTWTGRVGAGDRSGSRSEDEAVPGYGLFSTADGRQVSLGVVNEQHFWSGLTTELGLGHLAQTDFAERTRNGVALQKEIADAIALRTREELVTALVTAGVPVAPVLDRREMVAAAPFPVFPVRLDLPERPRPVPAVDEHRGQGFLPRP
jgi:crotonobetainyl-CoA:carnitine CoA-transferase CaiB-like acyl-CoA transferase